MSAQHDGNPRFAPCPHPRLQPPAPTGCRGPHAGWHDTSIIWSLLNLATPLPRSFHLPCTEAKLARAQTSLLVTFPLSTSLDYPIWRPSAVVSRASTTSRGLHPPPLHRGWASLSLDGLADHLPFLSHLRLPWPPLRATAHTLH